MVREYLAKRLRDAHSILTAALELALLAAFAFGVSAAPPGRLIDVGGRYLHLHCLGSGSPTVVLEAGAAEGWYSWHLIQERLSKELRVCSYDRAGFGYSDPRPGQRTVAGLIEDLHTLLERAGEKPPFLLVGHSFGGDMVVRYNATYPDEVSGLVLVDASHPDAIKIRPPEMQKLIDELSEKRPKQIAEWKKTGKWPEMWAPEKLPESLRREVLKLSASQKWWEARYAEGRMPDFHGPILEKLRTIDVPLAVIFATKTDKPKGWSDQTYTNYNEGRRALHKELASRSKDSEYIEAPTAHHVHVDDPQLVMDAIRRVARRSQE